MRENEHVKTLFATACGCSLDRIMSLHTIHFLLPLLDVHSLFYYRLSLIKRELCAEKSHLKSLFMTTPRQYHEHKRK